MADFDGDALGDRPLPNRSVGESETRMIMDGSTMNRMNVGRLMEDTHRDAVRKIMQSTDPLSDKEYLAKRHIVGTRSFELLPGLMQSADMLLQDMPAKSDIDEDKIRRMMSDLTPRDIFALPTTPTDTNANMSYSGDNKFSGLVNALPEWFPKTVPNGRIQSNGPGGDASGYREPNGHMGKAFMTDPWKRPEDRYKKYLEQLENRHVFVLAHDWTEILGEVIDTVKDDEVRLPYEECVFDFAFAKVKTMVIATQVPGGPISVRIAYHPGRGVSKDYEHYAVCSCVCGAVKGPVEMEGTPCSVCGYRAAGDPAQEHTSLVEPLAFYMLHVKAACVALDTELATMPTPYEVQQIVDLGKEIKLRARLDKTHVLCLKPRKQGARLTKNTGKTVRLHFRRGHWRHYANGNIKWIRWCIAGRAEIGAVIKSYKM